MYGEKRFDRAIDIISCDLKKDDETRENKQKVWKSIALSELIADDSFLNYFSKYELLEPVVYLY